LEDGGVDYFGVAGALLAGGGLEVLAFYFVGEYGLLHLTATSLLHPQPTLLHQIILQNLIPSIYSLPPSYILYALDFAVDYLRGETTHHVGVELVEDRGGVAFGDGGVVGGHGGGGCCEDGV